MNSHRASLATNRLVRGLSLLLSFILLAYLLKLFVLDELLDTAWMDELLASKGNIAYGYFVAMGAIASMVGLPRQAIAFFGGYAFGVTEGILLATLATTLGCILCFYYARFVGRNLVTRKYATQIRMVDSFLSQQTFVMTLVIRLLPVGSNLLTNLAAGVTGVRQSAFFAGSFFGYLPQMAIFALSGSGVSIDSSWQLALSLILFMVSLLLGLLLFQKYRKKSYILDAAVGD